MKRLTSLILLTALLSPLPSAAAGDTLRVITFEADPVLEGYLQAMTAADGDAVEFIHAPLPGTRPGKLEHADVLVIDQRHGRLAEWYARRMKGCRVLLRTSWAWARNYLGDVTVSDEFREKYGGDPARMYADINGEARRLVSGRVGVIPVGTAIQNVRGTWDRDNVTSDGIRLNSGMGSYVEACTWYEVLTGRDVRQNGFHPAQLYPERMALAREAARAAVANPWETSDFGFRKLNKNYDEARVPRYTLPQALTMADGTPVGTPEEWYAKRRPELLELFETQMYGRAPERPAAEHFEVVSVDDGALAGTAVRKEIRIYFTDGQEHYMTLLLYIPKQVQGPVPVFLGANFFGNATVDPDPGISYPDEAQIRRYALYTQHPRGEKSGRWPVGMILSRGYALATFHKSDLAPDYDSAFSRGVFPLFYKEGQQYPAPDEWGNISAWAWGYSRALDYLETDGDVDASRVATIGHSRLAKTALWAAVRDERFAMAVPNNPGCGGAAISRRCYGETLETIIRHYHYWFCGNFAQYSAREDALPFDQHELLSLMAPRPVYVGSGEHDRWSDPRGEFIALQEASRVYEFLGLPALGLEEMPGPWQPQQTGLVGWHMRSGPHEITAWDWAQYLDFADKHLKHNE